MSKKYENAPIIEAVCEFRLTPETQWDLTIPGLFYEKVREEFAKKEDHPIREVTFAGTSQGLQQKVQAIERVRFLTDDKKTFVQLGPRVLSINKLKPYASWEEFKPKIEKAFTALTSVVEINSIQRIGLRYINRIDISGQKVDMDEYFDFNPHLGKNLPQDMLNFIVGCTFPFHEGQDSCKIQLTDAIPNDSESVSFILDLDYFLAKAETVAKDTALEWVESAHDNLENVFEGCITGSLRKVFKEVD
ncbi:MAG: TIGR04255 family protein [Fidelibacterota bacterium]